MATLSRTQPTTLEVPALPRSAIDELYHFLQYLQFKYDLELASAIESLEDEIDIFDADVAQQESGDTTLEELKQEFGMG